MLLSDFTAALKSATVSENVGLYWRTNMMSQQLSFASRAKDKEEADLESDVNQIW